MHKDILKAATKESKISKEIIDILSEAVQKPDLDEFFLYGQKHFYYPNHKIKSYLDLTGKHNAKAQYQKHLKNISGSENPIEEVGRALHYLQDMSQPNHIENGSIIRKAKDAKTHYNFEIFALDNIQKFTDNHTLKHIEANSFDELFNNTIKLSKINSIPKANNTENWSEIAQDGINLAISATKKFIELLQDKFVL